MLFFSAMLSCLSKADQHGSACTMRCQLKTSMNRHMLNLSIYLWSKSNLRGKFTIDVKRINCSKIIIFTTYRIIPLRLEFTFWGYTLHTIASTYLHSWLLYALLSCSPSAIFFLARWKIYITYICFYFLHWVRSCWCSEKPLMAKPCNFILNWQLWHNWLQAWDEHEREEEEKARR